MFLISKCRGDWNLGLCPASVLAFAEPLRSSKIRFFLRRNMFFPRMSAKIYLPCKGEPQINKCGPWKGAGHCTLVLWTSTTSSSMRARQLHPFSSRVSAFERGPFPFWIKHLPICIVSHRFGGVACGSRTSEHYFVWFVPLSLTKRGI